MGFLDDALLIPLGLKTDPSLDRVMGEVSKDVKKRVLGMETGFGDLARKMRSSFNQIGGFMLGALGVGGAGALAYHVSQIADVEQATKRLGDAADLTEDQEAALAQATKDTATEWGVSRADQIAALKLLQDRYAVVNQLASEGTLEEQLDLAAGMANAFGMELTDVMNLMGSINQTMGVTGEDMTETMAYLFEASKKGSLGFQELGQVFPELLGAAKAFGQEGTEAIRTVGAMLETTTTYYKSAEKARTYTLAAINRLSTADVSGKLKKSLGVDVAVGGQFRKLDDIIDDTLDALGTMDQATAAAKLGEIFGSEEAVNAWKALLTERGTFENIISVKSGSDDFLKILDERGEDTATSLKKLKEKTLAMVDTVLLTDGNMAALSEVVDNLGISLGWLTGVFQYVGDAWSEILSALKIPEWLEKLTGGGNAEAAKDLTPDQIAARQIAGSYADMGPAGSADALAGKTPEQQQFAQFLDEKRENEFWSTPKGFERLSLKLQKKFDPEGYQELANEFAQTQPGGGGKTGNQPMDPAALGKALVEAWNKNKPKIEVTVKGPADQPPAEVSVMPGG